MCNVPTKILVFAGLLAMLGVASGAIIYTDPVDVHVGRFQQVFIDIDSNGTDDFYLSNTETIFKIVPLGSNSVYATAATPPNLGGDTTALDAGSLIGIPLDDPFSWLEGIHAGSPVLDVGGTLGFCIGGRPGLFCGGEFLAVEAFIGLQFEASDGQQRFGWLRLDATTGFGLAAGGGDIRDWAYESEPGLSIAAGAIPEPSATVMFFFGIGGLLLRRRR